MARIPLYISFAAVSAMVIASVAVDLHATGAAAFSSAGHGTHAIGSGPRWAALWFLPILTAVASAVMILLPRLPGGDRLRASPDPLAANWICGVVSLTAAHLCLLAVAAGITVDGPRVLAFGVAVTLCVCGNFYSKLRYNVFFGIRTPWTLASERVWDRTHRLVAWLMVGSGLLLLVLISRSPGIPLLAVGIAACSLTPMISGAIYSALIAAHGVDDRTLERDSAI